MWLKGALNVELKCAVVNYTVTETVTDTNNNNANIYCCHYLQLLLSLSTSSNPTNLPRAASAPPLPRHSRSSIGALAPADGVRDV